MRLAAAIQGDFRLQWRNGFYYAAAFVVVGTVVILRLLPGDVLGLLLPAFILQNVVINSFYFSAGQILLENNERTRAAQLVSPLRAREYLGAKVITLGVLSVAESLVLSLLLQGFGPGLVEFVLGVALASFLLTLLGIALVCPYESINEFIMPSVLFTSLLGVPMLGWFGFGDRILYDWHPLQGPLLLIGARHAPLEPARIVFSIALPLLWTVPIFMWSRRAMRRSVLT